jgi:hypothetical protein
MEPIGILFALIFVAAVVWGAGVYLFPFRACRKCGGTGRKIRKFNRSHFALCTRCAGTGRVQRPGSRLMHRAMLTARTELARQRDERRDRQAAERANVSVPPRIGYRHRS